MPKEVEVKTKILKCENCGATHNDYRHFSTCQICGKEVCSKCGEEVSLFRHDWDNWQDDILVHSECRRNHESWKDVYIRAFRFIEDEFYKEIEKLNKNYLSENDEYMRNWLDILNKAKEQECIEKTTN